MDPRTTRFRILYIEDNPADVRLLREALADCGFCGEIDVAPDAANAFARIARYRTENEDLPDLVLLDLNLPVVSGHKILNVLKGSREWRKVRIMVYTSSSEDFDRTICDQLGADQYLVKPNHWRDFQRLGHYLIQVLNGELEPNE